MELSLATPSDPGFYLCNLKPVSSPPGVFPVIPRGHPAPPPKHHHEWKPPGTQLGEYLPVKHRPHPLNNMVVVSTFLCWSPHLIFSYISNGF